LRAGDDPLMFLSTDEGRRLAPVEPAPGADALPVPGGYAQTGWPDTPGIWLSPDGLTWSYVEPPELR
ncbi:hypothetical protein NCC78_31365, partial [Micromonospora phytophila]|uniref:hypothetical protein n=1 Tax=Micromonospora phytophila TaxID=709888 RepID=UPI002030887F